MTLPDILTFADGERVQRLTFEKRRQEMLALILSNIYGTFDYNQKKPTAFALLKSHTLQNSVVENTVLADVDGFRFIFSIFEPERTTPDKRPVIIYLRLMGQYVDPGFLKYADEDYFAQSSSLLPIQYLVKKGYTVAMLDSQYISSDDADAKKTGVYKAFLGETSDCGQIMTWAWGVSRAADYFFNFPEIYAADKIGVAGHSRGGKTALLAAACDNRLGFAFSNGSGCAGAALHRNSSGESIEYINLYRPHWFNAKYKSYANRHDALPVDQHMLLACIAPRLVYVSSAEDDPHASPENEFLSCVLASSAYELLGLKGLVSDSRPQIEKVYHDGNIGYHIRKGKHAILLKDWQNFTDFLHAVWAKMRND